MRRTYAIVVLLVSAACSTPRRPVVNPGPTPSERLKAADALVRAGCLDCLTAAYREYDALRTVPALAGQATDGAVRASALMALRARELGMADDGSLKTARDLVAGASNVGRWLSQTVAMLDSLPVGVAGVARPPTRDADLERVRVLRLNRDARSAELRASSQFDELPAYAWLTLACDGVDPRATTAGEIAEAVSTFSDAPLMLFKEATCNGLQQDALQALLAKDPRFVEISYLLGLRAVGQRQLDEADRQFQLAYAWHPQWPALTRSIANVAMTAEEFPRAVEFYDKTLALDPQAWEAVLGKARALTYLGRHADAIAMTDRLLADQWFLGDARYWRALNEMQLSRNDAAWADVEEAAKLLINADVPKLAGMIAYRRQQPDVALAKFEESRERNRSDCETGFYLGVVLAEQRTWVRAADVLVETAGCLEDAEVGLRQEIDRIRASTVPPERQGRQVARREAQIAAGRRMLATSWFNTAVACFSLSRTDEARRFAEKVSADEQFGERARELLARLGGGK